MSLINKHQALIEKIGRNLVPFYCLLELTYKCNLKCIHCYVVRNERKELTPRQFFNILKQLKDLGTLYLTISGGEPLVREDFFEITEYAKKLNFALRIFTNATLINSKIADKIKKLKPLAVEVSLYGLEKTQDGITQVKGSFKRSVNGIKLLRRRGINVLAKSTLLNKNISEIWKLKKFVGKELKIKTRGIGGGLAVSPCDDGDIRPLSYLPTDEQLRWYMKEESKYFKKKWHYKEPDPDSNLCGAGIMSLNVTPYGEVNPCVQIRTKNKISKNKSIKDIWENDSEFKLFRNTKVKDLKECLNCEYKEYCFHCAGISYALYGSFTKPYPDACRQAKIRKEVYEEIYSKKY